MTEAEIATPEMGAPEMGAPEMIAPEMGASEIMAPEITTVDSRVVYRNRWMTVREDRIRRQDGSDGIYGVVDKPDFVVVIAVEPDGAMHLVEQYRYPIGAAVLGIAAGCLGGSAGRVDRGRRAGRAAGGDPGSR